MRMILAAGILVISVCLANAQTYNQWTSNYDAMVNATGFSASTKTWLKSIVLAGNNPGAPSPDTPVTSPPTFKAWTSSYDAVINGTGLGANPKAYLEGWVAQNQPFPDTAPTPTPTPAPGSVTLAWDPPSTITGYLLQWGTTKGGPYPNSKQVGLVYSYTLTGLPSGTTLYFVTQSYDASGNLSCESNEASTVVP